MKRILHIYGGIPSQGKLRRIMGLFADDGNFHEMYFFRFSTFNCSSENLSPASNIIIKAFSLKCRDYIKLPFIYYVIRLRAYSRMAAKLIPDEHLPDMVFSHDISWGLHLAAELADRYKLPLGFELHGFEEGREDASWLYSFYQKFHRPFVRYITKRLLRNVDFHLSQTRFIPDYLSRTMNFSPLCTAVCPNGVDPVFFTEKKWQNHARILRERYKWDDSVLILYSGYLDEINGINFLIKTIQSSPLEGAILIIAGMGPLQHKIESLARQNLCHYLEQIPPDEMPSLLAACDIFIVPRVRTLSGEMFFPIKLAEAMASGCAILASDLSAIREYINYDKNAWLFEPDDCNDFRIKLQTLINNSSLRNRLGNCAREKAVNDFGWTEARNQFKYLLERATKIRS